MLSRFTIQRAKRYDPNFLNCLIVCPFWASQASIVLKSVGSYAVMKGKDSNCVGILSDRGELQLRQTSVNML